MLHNNVVRLTEFLLSRGSIDVSKRPILVYGCELALSTLTSFASIVAISILMRDFFSSLLFIAIFFFLRLFAGGFHASTYARCFFITNGVYLATYGSAYILETYAIKSVTLIIGLVSGLIILFLTPVQNIKHPLSSDRLITNKKISRFLVCFEIMFLILAFFVGTDTHFFFIFATSLAAVAVMMVIPKFEERRG